MSLVALVPPALLGIVAMRFLGLRFADDRVGYLSWAWLCGCLCHAACLQIAIEVGFPLAGTLAIAGFATATLWLLPGGRGNDPADAVRAPAVGTSYATFVIAGVVCCLLLATAGMDRPCIEGDEGNIWSLKAKSLLVDWPEQFAAAQVYNLHPDYPQLNPLLQAWMLLMVPGSDFVHFENRWPVQLADVALFLAVAAAVRHRLAALPAALLASLLVLEPEFQSLCRTAYADGMLALGLVVAVDGFLRWRATDDRRFGWLAALGLAFASWSKNEAMLYCGCAVLAAGLTRLWLRPQVGGASARNVRMLLPTVIVVAHTAVWNRRFGMHSDLFGANPTGKSMFELMGEKWAERLPVLVAEAVSVICSLAHAHVIFGLLLLALVMVPRVALGQPLALPCLGLVGALAGIHVVYAGTFLDLRFHLDTSYARVTFQLLPAALVLVAAIASAALGCGRRDHAPNLTGLP